ncbi:MAG: V-type ATPase subunit [Candidatus Hydrothermarchaeota archaeon]
MSALYSYVNARIRAMKSYLLKKTEIRSLLEATSIEDALSFLRGTHYERYLADIEVPSLLLIEEALVKSFTEEYEKLIRSLHRQPREFLSEMGKKFEIDALKTVVRIKAADIKEKYPVIPFGRVDHALIESLMEIEMLEEMEGILKDLEYAPIIRDTVPKFREKGDVFPIETALDSYVYRKIVASMDKLSNQDKKIAKQFIGLEIDGKNLINVLRCRELEEEEISGYLIPYRYRLSDDLLNACFRAENIDIISSELSTTKYAEMVSKAVSKFKETGSLHPFELVLKESLLELSKNVFSGYPFHIGTVLGYLNLKENEIRNILTILIMKEAKLPASEVEKLILLT